jgi:hypothetical protein
MSLKRFIVSYGSVSSTGQLKSMLDESNLLAPGDEFRAWSEEDLPHWVKVKQRPHSQVAYILDQALIQQADFVLWLCPEAKVIKNLEPLWHVLDWKTSWFVCTGERCKTHPVVNACLNVNDENLPEVTTKAFGLDLRMPPTLRFLVDLKKHAKDGCMDGSTDDQFSYLFTTLAKRHELNAEEANHFLTFHKDAVAVLPDTVLMLV